MHIYWQADILLVMYVVYIKFVKWSDCCIVIRSIVNLKGMQNPKKCYSSQLYDMHVWLL